ncbi:MAG: hypothetical protein RH942_19110 [Kiloniellaceae bacterium]
MSKAFDIVASRLKNMLTRISASDADFEGICAQHAELTADIRKLNPAVDPGDAQLDDRLRRRRANLEQEMFAIMQANTRV